MTPDIKVISNLNIHNPADNTIANTGILEGRSFTESPEQEKKFKSVLSAIVPSIHDPHPSINIENLPSSLRSTVTGLKILDLAILDIFFVQTLSDLTELALLFPKQDLDTIVTHFSIILSLIRSATVNKETSEEVASAVLLLKKTLPIILPDLTEKLLENWSRIEKEISPIAQKMANPKQVSAINFTSKVKEAFEFLRTLINTDDCGFSVLDTSLVHIEQPEKSMRTVNDWLEIMVHYTKGTKQWFNLHSGFWAAAEPAGVDKNYSENLEIAGKLIQRRMNSNARSAKSLAQLRVSIKPFMDRIGKMYSNALTFPEDPSRAYLIDHLGFGIESIERLKKSTGLLAHDTLMHTVISSTYPEAIKMDINRMRVIEALHCSAISEMMRVEKNPIDSELLKKIISEAEGVCEFFLNSNGQSSRAEMFRYGTRRFSSEDVAMHIYNLIKILKEMSESPEQYSSSILYSLYDLKHSLCDLLVQGSHLCMDNLNSIHKELLKMPAEKNSVDPECLDSLLSQIHQTACMVEMLSGKSDIVNALIKSLIEGKTSDPKFEKKIRTKKKTTNRKKKKAKPKAVVKGHKKPAKATNLSKINEPFTSLKESEKTVDDLHSAPIVENVPSTDFTEVVKEDVSFEKATHRLIKASVDLQKSLEETTYDETLNDSERKLRNVKCKELCKELKEAGFVLMRSRGSHHQYVYPGLGIKTTVPVNSKDSVSTGVAKNVREQILKVRKSEK